ncbi:hypothetical protein J4H86_21630 [Spiractinospora alimapuensis]|uniref:hypothetical protein n=1 Tax=Spiractinospora alimapuensis TaxID=2820884 RepID=UPI001F2493A6|nr:hypothetical protein [Spiractinospora alimapuensis]QVQ51383.1 hypothetical protein J4H86_21630 [Spiractinospora alimapuensis]
MPEAALITAFALVASTLPLGYALREWWLRRQALDRIMVLPSSDLAERPHSNWYVSRPKPRIPGIVSAATTMRWLRTHPTVAVTTAAATLAIPFAAVALTGDTAPNPPVAQAPKTTTVSEPVKDEEPDAAVTPDDSARPQIDQPPAPDDGRTP